MSDVSFVWAVRIRHHEKGKGWGLPFFSGGGSQRNARFDECGRPAFFYKREQALDLARSWRHKAPLFRTYARPVRVRVTVEAP